MSCKPIILYRREQAGKTRQEILHLAADIASAEGLEGLSIGRLATELKMSKTGVFAHFGSKEELQLAVVATAKEVFLRQVVEPSLAEERGVPRLKAMLENWLAYVEHIVFRGGCFFAAASAEFDSRPGPVRKEIAALTKTWLSVLEDEIAFARSNQQLSTSAKPDQLAFELHAYVQEANWAFKLFNDRSAFSRARTAMADRLASQSQNQANRSKRKGRK